MSRGYLCANFTLPRPLCSRLRPDVHDRQTDVRRASSLNASLYGGRGINNNSLLIAIYAATTVKENASNAVAKYDNIKIY